MITIDDIRASPKLGRDKSLPLAKGYILIPSSFGGVESIKLKPKIIKENDNGEDNKD